MRQVELGIHDIEVDVGDHLCGRYARARQRDELVIPFLEAGRAGATRASASSTGSIRPRGTQGGGRSDESVAAVGFVTAST